MRRRVIASVFGLLAFLWGAFASAQEIRIDVGGQPTGGVPPVFQFGGGVWRIPKAMPWVAPSILDMRSGGGTYRAALSWEVLAASQSLDDLESRLASYRLNDFLSGVKAKGGQVIISLDAMPKWLAADKSETKMADGPAWAKSVPASGEQWAAVVQATVAHFNGKLGLNAFYEVWNEPDWSLRGSLDQYLELYRWSVVGAKRADPQARMAGPALSDWTSPGASGKQFFLQSFFDYAARTPATEVGLDRLPIDAVTWHAFYRDHAVSYDLAAKQIRAWLEEAGYPKGTMLILDEWNIASAEPPYPEGDINGGYAGATHVAATLMAMREAGIDRQTFQMMVDPGSKGYSGGAFTPTGVARPSFNAFRMFASLRGKQLPVSTSQKWVRSVAFADGKHVYLVIAVAPPSDYMLARGIFESLPIENPGAYDEIKRAPKEGLAAFLLKGERLPGTFSPATVEVLQHAREQFLAARQERESWKNGVKLHVTFEPSLGIKANAQHKTFDRNHAPDAAEMEHQSQSAQNILLDGFKKAQKELDASELQPGVKQQYLQAIKDNFDAMAVIKNADSSSQAVLKRADQLLTHDFSAKLSALDDANAKKLIVDSVAIHESTVELQSDGVALHYLLFDR